MGEQVEETKAKELQMAALEKQQILEFESYLAAASTKQTITEQTSLLLTQVRILSILYNDSALFFSTSRILCSMNGSTAASFMLYKIYVDSCSPWVFLPVCVCVCVFLSRGLLRTCSFNISPPTVGFVIHSSCNMIVAQSSQLSVVMEGRSVSIIKANQLSKI
jgi:hypothetical protein